MGDRVPDRLGLAALVPLGVGASSGGDGLDDLAVGGGVCQWKWASRSPGARVVRELTMKPTPASSRAFRLVADLHQGSHLCLGVS